MEAKNSLVLALSDAEVGLVCAMNDHKASVVIWTEGAFGLLDEVFGTFDKASTHKKDYV